MPFQGRYEFVEYNTRHLKHKEAQKDEAFPGGQTNYIPYDFGSTPERDLEQFSGDEYAKISQTRCLPCGQEDLTGSFHVTAQNDEGNMTGDTSGATGSQDDPQQRM